MSKQNESTKKQPSKPIKKHRGETGRWQSMISRGHIFNGNKDVLRRRGKGAEIPSCYTRLVAPSSTLVVTLSPFFSRDPG